MDVRRFILLMPFHGNGQQRETGETQRITHDAHTKGADKAAQNPAIGNAQHWAYLLNNGLYAAEAVMGSTNWEELRKEG